MVYLCNPNNPTGNIIPKNEVKKLLDSVPEDMTVFIDEAYHHFVDNPNLVNYQSLGKLNINISNFDDNSSISALIPGCSNYFDVKAASIPRNATEAWVNYNPGGASIDLIQGLYQVSVVVAGATSPIWQEQVAIAPDNTVTRNVTLPGINSTLTSTLSLTIANGLAAGHNLQFYQGSTSLGTISAGTTAALAEDPAIRQAYESGDWGCSQTVPARSRQDGQR